MGARRMLMSLACMAMLVAAGGCGGGDDDSSGDTAATSETGATSGGATGGSSDGGGGSDSSDNGGGGGSGSATIAVEGGETLEFTLTECEADQSGLTAEGDTDDGEFGLVFSLFTAGGEPTGTGGINVNNEIGGVQFDPTDLEVDGSTVSGEVTIENPNEVEGFPEGATATVEINC